MQLRKPIELITARAASDGAGVKLLRVFGGARPERFDPFLMLDEFGSDEAADYLGGFPPHPHRGFETITYMLNGKMEHRDHLGNVGLLNDGDVQWMTAASGVIHSEMPQQTEGLMRGFQLWLNLPASGKMAPAEYQDVAAARMPVFHSDTLGIVAIAGQARLAGEDQPLAGYFERPQTQPLLWDVRMVPGGELTVDLATSLNVMIYVYEGAVDIAGTVVQRQQLARLGAGDGLQAKSSGDSPARMLLIAGVPLKEPIVQYGPFVMNSSEEIEQAIRDYKEGRLGSDENATADR